jgi:dTDP-4-dehydrorhamnose 3,5-epimerase
MRIRDLSLKGLKLIEPDLFFDRRGVFFETYRISSYQDEGVECAFVQDNVSISKKNTVRGMHFQAHPGQDKLVTVLQGEIWDVAVDIRLNSETFGCYEAVVLDDKKMRQFFIPKGFAHGFCVLSEKACVLYKCSAVFSPETEKGFRWDDPDLGIPWPVPDPILSKRDLSAPFFKEAFQEISSL